MDPSAMERVLSGGDSAATYILPEIFKYLENDDLSSAWAVSKLWQDRAEEVLTSRFYLEEDDSEFFCSVVNQALCELFHLTPSGEDVEPGPMVVAHPCSFTQEQVQQTPVETEMAAVNCDSLLFEDATPLIVLQMIARFNWDALTSLNLRHNFGAEDWNRFGRFIISELQSLHTLNVILQLKSKARLEDGFGALMDVVRGAGNEPNAAMTNLQIFCPLVVNHQNNELPLKPLLQLDFLSTLCPNLVNYVLTLICRSVPDDPNQDQLETLGTVCTHTWFRENRSVLSLAFEPTIGALSKEVPDPLKTPAALDRVGTELRYLATLCQYETLVVHMIDGLDLASAALPLDGTYFRRLSLRFSDISFAEAHRLLSEAINTWSMNSRFDKFTELSIRFYEDENQNSRALLWTDEMLTRAQNGLNETQGQLVRRVIGLRNITKLSVFYGAPKTNHVEQVYLEVMMDVFWWLFVFRFLLQLSRLHTNANFKRLHSLLKLMPRLETVVHRYFNSNEDIRSAVDAGLLCHSNLEIANPDTTKFRFSKGDEAEPDLDLTLIERYLEEPLIAALFENLPL